MSDDEDPAQPPKVSIANQVMMERLELRETQVEVTSQTSTACAPLIKSCGKVVNKLLTSQSTQHGCRDFSRRSEHLQLSAPSPFAAPML